MEVHRVNAPDVIVRTETKSIQMEKTVYLFLIEFLIKIHQLHCS